MSGPLDFSDLSAPKTQTPEPVLTPAPQSEEQVLDFSDLSAPIQNKPVTQPTAPKPTKRNPPAQPTPSLQPQKQEKQEKYVAPSIQEPQLKLQPITEKPVPVKLNIGQTFSSHEVPNLDDRAMAYQNPGTYLAGLQGFGTPGSPVVKAGADLANMSQQGISATARLAHSLKYSQLAKQGYTFAITSGYRGNSTTHHGAGDALDIQIFKDGKMVGSTAREGWGDGAEISQEEIDQVANYAKRAGFKGMIDEINYPTAHATGPHIHFAVGLEEGAGGKYGNLKNWKPGSLPALMNPVKKVTNKIAGLAGEVLERFGQGRVGVRQDYVKNTAKGLGFSPEDQEIFLQQLEAESGRTAFIQRKGRREAYTSPVGAIGVGQFMPETLDWVTSNPKISGGITKEQYLNDPGAQVRLSARYMQYLLQKTDGNWAQALTAYNAGEGYLQRFLADENTPLYEETKNYVAKIMGKASGFNIDPDKVADIIRNPAAYDMDINLKYTHQDPSTALGEDSTVARYANTLLQTITDTAQDFASDTVTVAKGEAGNPYTWAQGDFGNLGKSMRDPNLPTVTKAFMGGLAKATNALSLGAVPFLETAIMSRSPEFIQNMAGYKGYEDYQPWTAPWADVENAIDANWDDLGIGSLANTIYEVSAIGAMFSPVSLWGRSLAGFKALGGSIGGGAITNQLAPFLARVPFFGKAGGYFTNLPPQFQHAITFGISAGVSGAVENFYDKTRKGEYKDADWSDIMGEFLGKSALDSTIGAALGMGGAAIGSLLGAGAMGMAHIAGQAPEASALMLSALTAPAKSVPGQIAQGFARTGIGAAGGGLLGSAYSMIPGVVPEGQSGDSYMKGGALAGGAILGGGGALGGKILASHLEKYMAAMENPVFQTAEEAFGVGEGAVGLVKGITERMHPNYQAMATSYFTKMLKSLPPLPTKFYEALTYDAVGAALQANRRAAASLQYEKMVTHSGNIVQSTFETLQTEQKLLQQLEGQAQKFTQQIQAAETQLQASPFAEMSVLDANLQKAEQKLQKTSESFAQQQDPKKQKVLQGLLNQQTKERDYAFKAAEAKRRELAAAIDPSGKSQLETYGYLQTGLNTNQVQLEKFTKDYGVAMADLKEKLPLMQEFAEAQMKRHEWLASPETKAARESIDPYVYKSGSPKFDMEQQALDQWLSQSPEVKVNGRFSDPIQQEAFEQAQLATNRNYRNMFMSRGTSSAGILYQDLENQLIGQFKSMLDPEHSLQNIVEQTTTRLEQQLQDLKGVESRTLFHRARGVMDVPDGQTVSIRYREAKSDGRSLVWVSPSSLKNMLTEGGQKVTNESSYFGALTQHAEQVRAHKIPSVATLGKAKPQSPFKLTYRKGSGWGLSVPGAKKNPSTMDYEIARLEAYATEGETAIPIQIPTNMLESLERRIGKQGPAEHAQTIQSLKENLETLQTLKPFMKDVGFEPKKWDPFGGVLDAIGDVSAATEDNIVAKQINELLQQSKAGTQGAVELTGSNGEKVIVKGRNGTPESAALSSALLGDITGHPESGKKVDALKKVLENYRSTNSNKMGQDIAELREVFWNQFTPQERSAVIGKEVNDLQRMLAFANDPATLTARSLDQNMTAQNIQKLQSSLTPEELAAAKAFYEGFDKMKYYQPISAGGHSMLYLHDSEGSYKEPMSSQIDEINRRGGLKSEDVFGATTQELPRFLYQPMQALWKISRAIETSYKADARALSKEASQDLWTGLMFPDRIGELVQKNPAIQKTLAPMYHMVGELQRLEKGLSPDMKALADTRFRMSIFPRLDDHMRKKSDDQSLVLTDILREEMNSPGLLGNLNRFLNSMTKTDGAITGRSVPPLTKIQQLEDRAEKALAKWNVTPDEYVSKDWKEAAKILPDTAARLERYNALPAGQAKEAFGAKLRRDVLGNQAMFLMSNMEKDPGKLLSSRFRSVFSVIHANDMVKYFNGIKILPSMGETQARHPDGIIHLSKDANGVAPVVKTASGGEAEYKLMKNIPGYRNFEHTTDLGAKYSADKVWVHPEWAKFVEGYFHHSPSKILEPLQKINRTASQAVLLGSFLPHYTSLFSNFLLEHGMLNPLRAVGVMKAGTNLANSELGYFLQADAARSGLNIQTLDKMSNLMAAQIAAKGYSPEERSEYFSKGPFNIVPNTVLPGQQAGWENPYRKATNGSFGDIVAKTFSHDTGEAQVAAQQLKNLSPFLQPISAIGQMVGSGSKMVFDVDAAMNMAMLHKPIQQAALASYYLKASEIMQRQGSTGLAGLSKESAWRVSKQVAAQIINRTAAVLPYYWNGSGTRNVMNAFMTTPDWFRNQANAFKETLQSVLPIGTKRFSSLPEPMQKYVINDSAAKFRNALTGMLAGNTMVSFMTSGNFDMFHPVDSFMNGVEFVDHMRENPNLLTRAMVGNDTYATPIFGMYRMFARSLIEAFGSAGKPDGMNLLAPFKYLAKGQVGPAWQFAGSLAGMFSDPFSEQIPKRGGAAQAEAIVRKAMDVMVNSEEIMGTSSRGTGLLDFLGLAWDPLSPRLTPEERLMRAAGVIKTPRTPPSEIDKRNKGDELFVKNQTETRVLERLEWIKKQPISEAEKRDLRYKLRDKAVNLGFGDIDIPDSMKNRGEDKYVMTPEQWENMELMSTNPELFYMQLADDRRKKNAAWGVDIDRANEEMYEAEYNKRKSPILSLLKGQLYEPGSPAQEAAQKLMRMANRREQ